MDHHGQLPAKSSRYRAHRSHRPNPLDLFCRQSQFKRSTTKAITAGIHRRK
jgi:hypothetical protein